MQTVSLSESAHALLRRRLAGERMEVTDETRPLYRELVDAGMMMPLHTFACRLTARVQSLLPLCNLWRKGILCATFGSSPLMLE